MLFKKIDLFLTDIIDGFLSFVVYPFVVIKIGRHKLNKKITWERQDIKFCVNLLDFYKLNPEFASATILKYKGVCGLFNPGTNEIHINLSRHKNAEHIINTIIHESIHKEISRVCIDARNNLYDDGEELIIDKILR